MADGTKAPRSKPYKGEISLAGVTDEAPVTRTGFDFSEYQRIVEQSWAKKQAGHQQPAIGVTLPAEAVATAKTRFRQASARIDGVGVTFDEYGPDSDRGRRIGLQPGQMRLVVEAKSRKVVPPRKASATPAAAPAKSAGGLPKVQKTA